MGFFDTGKPLTAGSDNLHMGTLADIARVVAHPYCPGIGDSIDQGLIMLRLLNEAGYDVIPREGAPIKNSTPKADYLPTIEQIKERIKSSRAALGEA